MAEHIPDMFVLFSKTINDAESLATRVVTLRALGKIAEYIDPDGSEVVSLFFTLIIFFKLNHHPPLLIHNPPFPSLSENVS